jgi:hypothetical protein
MYKFSGHDSPKHISRYMTKYYLDLKPTRIVDPNYPLYYGCEVSQDPSFEAMLADPHPEETVSSSKPP